MLVVSEFSEYDEVDDKQSDCWDPGSMVVRCRPSRKIFVALLAELDLSRVFCFGVLVGKVVGQVMSS